MDETNLLLDEHPKMFRTNPVLFTVAILLCLAGVAFLALGYVFMLSLSALGFLILGWMYIKSKGERIAISPNALLIEKGILNKDRTESLLSGIRTINVNQTFTQRIFNVGRIEIYTTGDEPEASINGVYQPNRVRDIIRARQASMVGAGNVN